MCVLIPSEIEKIEKQAAELTAKLKVILERRSLTTEQAKTTADAYGNMLWWRRMEFALMTKAFGKTEDSTNLGKDES